MPNNPIWSERFDPGAGAGAASVQEESAIQRVPLPWDEAGVADDAAELFFGGAVVGAGGGDDVLLDHDAAHVVAAETETELAGLEALGHPGRLDVVDVVEVEAGKRQGLWADGLTSCGPRSHLT